MSRTVAVSSASSASVTPVTVTVWAVVPFWGVKVSLFVLRLADAAPILAIDTLTSCDGLAASLTVKVAVAPSFTASELLLRTRTAGVLFVTRMVKVRQVVTHEVLQDRGIGAGGLGVAERDPCLRVRR